MRYFVRALKYFIYLVVLLVGLVWIMTLLDDNIAMGLWEYIGYKFSSEGGAVMIVALVALSALYPLFGYMRKSVAQCSLEEDKLRIHNAMLVYGYKYVGECDGAQIYRSMGILRRLTLRFEDKIELRQVGDAVEFYGLRSQVARVTYQLQGYLNSKRYEKSDEK